MIKRILLGLLTAAVLLTAGCAAPAPESADIPDQRFEAGQSSSGTTLRKGLKDKMKKSEESQSFGSEEEILSYLAGTWELTDTESGEDYASLKIEENGAIAFSRPGADTVCEGVLSFEPFFAQKSRTLNSFHIILDEIPEEYEDPDPCYGRVDSSGLFRTGQAAGEDYLFLEEIGNGDSYLSYSLFQPERIRKDDEAGRGHSFLLHRANRIRETAAVSPGREYYAYVWARDEDGTPLAQAYTPEEKEYLEDYTNRRFTGGIFQMTQNLELFPLELSEDTDLTLVENRKAWESQYPLTMYSVEEDRAGRVTRISEVPRSFYGIYDLGELEPEFSWHDQVFTYNGVNYFLEDYETPANAIMDCVRVGRWIVAECHVNPNVSQYLLFSIDQGDFLESITGTNLIWQGDDISTAVYLMWDSVYNYKGDPIGSVQEGEIFDLSFSEDGSSVLAECWKIEGEEEVTFTEEFEYEYPDSGMYRYKDWRLRDTPEHWAALMEEAPENAECLIMVNPPEDIPLIINETVEIDPQAYDRVYVFALKDDTRVQIDKEETVRLDQGQLAEFVVTVPEGMPTRKMKVTTEDGEAEWEVFILSGKTDQRSTFLVSEE